jgi:spore germination cell wall hydrolase CwlJ-like protein
MRFSPRASKGAIAPFGVAVLVFVLAPARAGYQDLNSLISRSANVAESSRDHAVASPFGKIRAATFSFPRPIGSGAPAPIGYGLGRLPREPEIADLILSRATLDAEFSRVNRTRKGDRLVPRQHAERHAPPMQREDATARLQSTHAANSPERTTAGESETTGAGRPMPEPDWFAVDALEPDAASARSAPEASPTIRSTRVYFGSEPIGGTLSTIEPWAPGEGPVVEPPSRVAAIAPGEARLFEEPSDSAAIAPADAPASEQSSQDAGGLGEPGVDGNTALASLAPAEGGETIAEKGEVTGEGRAPQSPAERLGLAGPIRERAEKCLAEAVYFEARGEPVRGQMAVAQVVMNRVFSGYYPETVCGVVYQNAHRRLACQFTFACDGQRDRIAEPDAWERAKNIARDTLDGKYWLTDIGKATHYHAYWVHPGWVRTMRKLDKIGVHTFYRPLRWGDGDRSPVWGDASATSELVNKL